MTILSVFFSLFKRPKNDLFAGTNWGVYKSTDIGETWTEVNNGLVDIGEQPRWNLIWNLANNPQNDYIFAATGKTIFISKDNGNSWSKTGLTDAQLLAYWKGIAINNHGTLFAAAWTRNITLQTGIYYSEDNGDSWSKVDKGLALPKPYSITIDPDGYLYVGTAGGLYRTDKPTTK